MKSLLYLHVQVNLLSSDKSKVGIVPTQDMDWLLDNNQSTCNGERQISQITVHWAEPEWFLGIRIEVNAILKMLPSDDVISLNMIENSTSASKCHQMSYYEVSENVLDVKCHLTAPVVALNISGRMLGSLCSLYVHGGQNVALKASVLSSSSANDPSLANDGNTSRNESLCFQSQRSGMASDLIINFNGTRRVYKVLIMFTEECCIHRPGKLQVQLVGHRNQTLQDSNSPAGNTETFVFRPTEVIQLVITSQGVDPESKVTVCEVQVFGDAPLTNQNTACQCVDGGNCIKRGGNCRAQSKCPEGWTSYSCLYRNLVALSNISGTSLGDNDDRTCDPSVAESATIQWGSRVRIMWVELVFQGNASFENFFILFGHEKISLQVDMVTHIITEGTVTTVRLDSRHALTIQWVTVSWTGKGSLCSVNVIGGRNVASINFCKPVLLFGDKRQNVQFDLMDADLTTCQEMRSEDGAAGVEFVFQHEVNVIEVILYKNVTRHKGGSLLLKFVSENGMISYNLSFPNTEDVTQKLLAAVDFSSKSIQLQVLDGDLTLCEVEIFAECWPPMYGDQCEYTCNSSCSDRRCLYDGQCFECQGTAAQNESCPSYVNESFKSERSLAPKMLVYSSLPVTPIVLMTILLVIGVCVYPKRLDKPMSIRETLHFEF